MSIPTFETERLRLRPFVHEDAVRLHQILAVDGVLRYYPSSDPPDLERVERLVARQLNTGKSMVMAGGRWMTKRIRS